MTDYDFLGYMGKVAQQVRDDLRPQPGRLLALLDEQDRTEVEQIAADLDQIEAGEAMPEPGDLLTVDQLPCVSYIRVNGDDYLYLGHRQGLMDLVDDRGVHATYPAGDGETFPYVSDLI